MKTDQLTVQFAIDTTQIKARVAQLEADILALKDEFEAEIPAMIEDSIRIDTNNEHGTHLR